MIDHDCARKHIASAQQYALRSEWSGTPAGRPAHVATSAFPPQLPSSASPPLLLLGKKGGGVRIAVGIFAYVLGLGLAPYTGTPMRVRTDLVFYFFTFAPCIPKLPRIAETQPSFQQSAYFEIRQGNKKILLTSISINSSGLRCSIRNGYDDGPNMLSTMHASWHCASEYIRFPEARCGHICVAIDKTHVSRF
jgi:hypothetical protein